MPNQQELDKNKNGLIAIAMIEQLFEVEDEEARLTGSKLMLAYQMAKVENISLALAVAYFTNLYRQAYGTKHRKQAELPTEWIELFENLPLEGDIHSSIALVTEAISKYKQARDQAASVIPEQIQKPEVRVGWWAGTIENAGKAVMLHLQPDYGAQPSDLRKDFKSLLAEVYQKYPEAEHVTGSSWLYDSPAARRYLPESLIKKCVPVEPEQAIQSGSVWGQFYNVQGGINAKNLAAFINKIPSIQSAESIKEAFSFWPQEIRGSVSELYKEYGI